MFESIQDTDHPDWYWNITDTKVDGDTVYSILLGTSNSARDLRVVHNPMDPLKNKLFSTPELARQWIDTNRRLYTPEQILRDVTISASERHEIKAMAVEAKEKIEAAQTERRRKRLRDYRSW